MQHKKCKQKTLQQVRKIIEVFCCVEEREKIPKFSYKHRCVTKKYLGKACESFVIDRYQVSKHCR